MRSDFPSSSRFNLLNKFISLFTRQLFCVGQICIEKCFYGPIKKEISLLSRAACLLQSTQLTTDWDHFISSTLILLMLFLLFTCLWWLHLCGAVKGTARLIPSFGNKKVSVKTLLVPHRSLVLIHSLVGFVMTDTRTFLTNLFSMFWPHSMPLPLSMKTNYKSTHMGKLIQLYDFLFRTFNFNDWKPKWYWNVYCSHLFL